jgi:hypothetical protein
VPAEKESILFISSVKVVKYVGLEVSADKVGVGTREMALASGDKSTPHEDASAEIMTAAVAKMTVFIRSLPLKRFAIFGLNQSSISVLLQVS